MITTKKLSSAEKMFLVNLYFARKQSSDPEYKKRKEYYETLAGRYGKKYSTIKNNQDRLDASFDNGRRGWHQVPLEKQNKQMYNMFQTYKDLDSEELKKAVEEILTDPEQKAPVYYSIKTKNPVTVQNIQKSKNGIEIDKLNILREQLKIGQVVFIVLGGDKGTPDVTWETGLVGIGIISEEPYDLIGRDYKIKIDVKLLLDYPVTRESLVPYPNTYNIIGIGPITKWEPNQAISQISESKTATLVRALLDRWTQLEEELERIFGSAFMMNVKSEEQYLVSSKFAYGEKLDLTEPDDRDWEVPTMYEPDITAIADTFQMALRPLEALKNYINIGKHLILSGPPGTGKTSIAERAALEAERIHFVSGSITVTATSEWSTFDTIGGYMPDEGGKLEFQEGVVLGAIRDNKWVIIDEINRAEIDKAFGSLFTLLSDKNVELPYKFKGKPVRIVVDLGPYSFFREETATYHVGRNWRIIGTMNTYDKNSLFSMSYAFMRRFAFIDIPIPKPDLIRAFVDSSGLNSTEKSFVMTILEASPKPFGPAVLKEVINYLNITNGKGKLEAMCATVLPQLEGLASNTIKNFFTQTASLFLHEDRTEYKEFVSSFFDLRPSYLELPAEINEDEAEE